MPKKGEKIQSYNPQNKVWVLMEATGKNPVWRIKKSQKKPFPGVRKNGKKKKSGNNTKAETGVTSSTIIPNFLEWF